MDFGGKVMSLLFNMLSRWSKFPFKELVSFNFMATITICSDFGAQKNKVRHCFHCLPIYFPWSFGTRCMILVFLLFIKWKQNKTKPSIRKIKYLFQSHSASKWQSQDLSMDVYSHTTKCIYLHVSKLYAKLPSSLFFSRIVVIQIQAFPFPP